jgi:hypothetical protein
MIYLRTYKGISTSMKKSTWKEEKGLKKVRNAVRDYGDDCV